MNEDILTGSLSDAAAAIRAGRVLPVALTENMLARIAREDERLHAYVLVTPERALEDARRAEAELARGEVRGPLHGVPIALKDLVDTAGIATAGGTKVMADRIPAEDATVAARLRDAGAVLLGKLVMTEGALSQHRPERPAPVNPWGAQAWTGVSSSGAGVAVAAGLAFAAIGSDTGGSIRFPSGACGVTGLKPSWGRVSRRGILPMAPSLDHVGPMARTAEDCAIMLSVIAGSDPRDPSALRVPAPSASPPAGIEGVRIGLDRGFALDSVHPAVAAALEAALAALGALGASVREVRLPPSEAFARGWAVTCGVEAASFHKPWYDEDPENYEKAFRALLALGNSVPAMTYAALHEARLAFKGAVDAMFEEVDLIAMPVMPMPTPSLATIEAGAGDPETVAATLRFTAPWNYSGHPSLTLPAGFDPDGLPIGIQLVGPALAEERLLGAGMAFQAATDWHRRRPREVEAIVQETPLSL
jgi:amidase